MSRLTTICLAFVWFILMLTLMATLALASVR